MLLGDLVEDYCAVNPFVRSPDTKRLLLLSARHFSDFLGHPARSREFSDRGLAAYMAWRRAAGLAETTIERESSKLLTLWRFAAQSGSVPPPRIRVAKAPVGPPVAFSRSELRRLFRAASRYPVPICGRPGRLYMLPLLGLAFETGERIGALLQLERGDVVGRWVTIRKRKGAGQTLVRQISRGTARAVAELSGPKLFAGLDRTSVYYHLGLILVAAGLPTDRRHKFHAIRRSHASYLYRAGGDPTNSLGHSSEAITRVYYLDQRIVGGRQPVSYLFNPLRWDWLLRWFVW